MAPQPQPLIFHRFGEDPLDELSPDTRARGYLRCYLADLGATTVIEEPYYFDRDYLAEFSAFYSTSASGYGNVCRRLHFFAGEPVVDREALVAAAGVGPEDDAVKKLQASYLGFAVVRPFEPPRLGRTVLRWYPDHPVVPLGPRVSAPSRKYRVHLAGVPLDVHGLAWQQQDASVGTCATVALWSMLHSSAFDDHHAIPTTAQITLAAHRRGGHGSRVFPSSGLTAQQLAEAVVAHGLSPLLLEGDIPPPRGSSAAPTFSRERFASSVAAFIRSGYPVLVAGSHSKNGVHHGEHAVCITGFRSRPPQPPAPGTVVLADESLPHVYVHDDNLGPNVRFTVSVVEDEHAPWIELGPSPPSPRNDTRWSDPTPDYPRIVPSALMVAVHDELRMSPDMLHEAALSVGKVTSVLLSKVGKRSHRPAHGISLSSRFIGVREYMRDELARVFPARPDALARVRLALLENVAPMSLHIGVVRMGFGELPFADILYDTTESGMQPRAFAHVGFGPRVEQVMSAAARQLGVDLGVYVDGQ